MRAYTHLAPFGGVNENTNGLPREYCPKHQGIVQYSDGYIEKAVDIGWCPKMYADKRRANKKQQRHGIFELCKFKLPFAVPVAVDRI